MRPALALVLVAAGCGGASRPEPGTPAPAHDRLRVTPRVAAPCGPDWLERHARSVSDLDGDGTLDRVSVIRAGDVIEVRLHAADDLRETRRWTLPAGYLELATPRRRGGTRGDLWITVGHGDDKPWDGSSAPESVQWTETLYHLEDGELVAVTEGYRDIDIRIDVDGDGVVDPMGSGGGLRVLLDERWVDIPTILSSQVDGAPVDGASGQEEAIDLDSNGVRELALERDGWISLVETPSFEPVWAKKGDPYDPRLVRRDGAWVLEVDLERKRRVFATDAEHAELAVVEAAAVPVRLARGEAPGLIERAWSGLGQEIRFLDPETRAVRRVLWSDVGGGHGYTDHGVEPIDLDGDGVSELLLSSQHHEEDGEGGGSSTRRLRVLDGHGRVLWEEAEASTMDTHVRPVDLGDGTTALRIRTEGVDEYYVVSPRSKRTAIPACLE